MLLLLGGGELDVLRMRIKPGVDSGHLVNFFLEYNSFQAGIRSTLSASPTSPMALPATFATLESRDIVGLMGWGFSFLRALVINIEPHHSIKLMELLAVNHYRTLEKGKGRITDPVLKIMDLRGLFKRGHIPLG
jgi:hypothetical protein